MRYASRKFIVAMYFGTMVGALCWFGKIPGIAAASAIGIIAGVYKMANAYESTVEPVQPDSYEVK